MCKNLKSRLTHYKMTTNYTRNRNSVNNIYEDEDKYAKYKVI